MTEGAEKIQDLGQGRLEGVMDGGLVACKSFRMESTKRQLRVIRTEKQGC